MEGVQSETLIVSACKERGGNGKSDYAVKQNEETGPSPINIDFLTEYKS
jgi:hypothetical protein